MPTLDRRVCVLEAAQGKGPVLLLISWKRSPHGRISSATVAGANIQRDDDESEDQFHDRIRREAIGGESVGACAVFINETDERL